MAAWFEGFKRRTNHFVSGSFEVLAQPEPVLNEADKLPDETDETDDYDGIVENTVDYQYGFSSRMDRLAVHWKETK